jgi:predicted AlkP superfamily phosphohydrolase/phosphomutase
MRFSLKTLLLWFASGLLLPVSISYAYIGPGAGFAVISSFLVILLTVLVAFLTLLIWPFRALLLYIRRLKTRKNRRVPRVVVLGLDGLAPTLVQKYMRQGLLANFSKLKETGSFRALATTMPSISPVAWSTFSTGVNPGKHRIFDFYTRDPATYLPVLSSTKISTFTKTYRLGPIRIPRKITKAVFLRKSTSFWKILGKYGIFSSVLRVPISYPPEKFHGTCLSAMCAPDLRGTQGAFTFFTTENRDLIGSGLTESALVTLSSDGKKFSGKIPGPAPSEADKPLTFAFTGELSESVDSAKLFIDGKTILLAKDQYSDWIRLKFKNGHFRSISGTVRFLLLQTTPDIRIYMTPINIDPEKPALPVSHPLSFSMALAKIHGSFSTLGLAEDTWALNERVIDEDAFLRQAYDIYEERKKHLFDALEKNKRGLVVSVFDTTDRIQHMFFRYLDESHPANADKDKYRHKDVIKDLYIKMDQLLGEVLAKLRKDDLLMVISDHGFSQFKWGVNLNSWLYREGYLVLKNGVQPEDGDKWFKNVDWNRTRAYALGLTGLFINLQGRERFGIVRGDKERLSLQLDLKEKLEAMWDEKHGQHPIRRALLPQMNLKGPYLNECPDLIIGYKHGYRVSWNSAVGIITRDVVEDNTKSWSGDHSIDPELVPGVFFSNWRIETKKPSIEDLAPTILNLFGIPGQSFHDGRVLNLHPPL